MVVQNAIFPLYEVEWGDKYILNIKLKDKKPINDYLRLQGRFLHLNEKEIAFMQEEVDKKWGRLLALVDKCQ
jgi:pyruvate ferredoxin oxidoreductase beta subunit